MRTPNTMTMDDAREYLRHLLLCQIVRKDGHEFIGRASDGTEVLLGDDHPRFFPRLLRYLIARPNPEQW